MRERSKRSRRPNRLNDFYYPPQQRRRRNRSPQPQQQNQPEPSDSDSERPPSPQIQDQPIQNPALPMIQENLRTEVQKEAAGVQTEAKTVREKLNEIYTDPDFPSAYSADLRKFLQSKESLSRHKKIIKKFKRRKIFVHG